MGNVNSNGLLIVYGHFYCGQALHLAQVLQEIHQPSLLERWLGR